MTCNLTKAYCADNLNFSDRIILTSACRTPIGSYKGAYSDLTTIELASTAVKSSINNIYRDYSDIQALYAGVAIPSGLGQAVDKHVVVKSGLPNNTISVSVNKVCASGMKAVQLACNELRLNYFEKGVVCVGAENMTRAQIEDGLIDFMTGKQMGEINASLANELEITREMQDQYAISSYERSIKAWNEGVMNNEICLVSDGLTKDEDLKKYKPEKIPLLKSTFGNSVTAANSSSLADGAAAITLCKESFALTNNMNILGEIIAYADSANDPEYFGIAPHLAIKNLAGRFGCEFEEFSERIKLWEINEAFSTVVLANMSLLSLDRELINIHGGAVSIGHPLGMSGTRIIVHMIHVLQKGEMGVCTICNGGGGASAILLKKM